MASDQRQKPWRKLRAVVEVTVPPTSRADEKDLVYLVQQALPRELALPRPIHANARLCSVRVRAFGPYYRAEKVKERRK